MVIKVQGVYENGAVPETTADPLAAIEAPISFSAGEDVTVELTVVDPAGEPVDITGATFALGIREFDFDETPALSRSGEIEDAEAGRVDFTIVPVDTKDLASPNRYRWVIWMVIAGTGQEVILLSDLQLRAPGLLPSEAGSSDDAWVPPIVPTVSQVLLLSRYVGGEFISTTADGSEDVLPAPVYLDFDRLDESVEDVICALQGAAKVSGGTATIRVRLGGTKGGTSGTIIATGTVTGTSYAAINLTAAAFAKPSGLQILQVTVQNAADAYTYLDGATVELRSA